MKETEDRRARNRPFLRSKIFIAFWKLSLQIKSQG